MSITAPIWGVDVSDHQGPNVDFEKLRAQGYRFAGIKASEGIGWWAKNYKTNVVNCREAGMIPMPYHFLWGNDPVRQMQTFLNAVGNPEGKILALDAESYNGQVPPKEKHIFGAMRELARRVGKKEPIVNYSGDWYWVSAIGNPRFAEVEAEGIKPMVWTTPNVGYAEGPGTREALYRTMPASEWKQGFGFGGRAIDILQFTAEGSAAGMSPLDLNAFRGSVEELRAMAHPAKTVAPGPDGDTPPREVKRSANLHKPTPGHKAPPKKGIERVTLPEAAWDHGSGSYVAQHPTHYRLRDDIREVALWLLNHPKLRGKISINTYRDHPPGWGLDATSFDVWLWAGRGHWLTPELRRIVFDLLFNKTGEPNIRWCISGGLMWTPNGFQDAPAGPAGSDADHIGHGHYTYW